MKTIRKIEDLDWLENGKGLKVFIDNNDKTLSVGAYWDINLISGLALSEVDDNIISLIKAMGFEFEWKPKRELEEIIASYEEVEFIMGENNWCITKVERDSYCWYRVEEHFATQYIGAKYYEKEDAIKIVNELNQIA